MTQSGQKSPTCWFCLERLPDRDSASKWDMYRETKEKGPFGGAIGLDWETETVPVPRCAECKRSHDSRERFVERGWKVGMRLGIVVAAAALVIGWSGVLGVRIILGFRLTAIIIPAIVISCGIIGGIIGWLAGKSSLPQGVKDQSLAVLHPNVRSMEGEGWKIGTRPPQIGEKQPRA
jgi:hypothetical protein